MYTPKRQHIPVGFGYTPNLVDPHTQIGTWELECYCKERVVANSKEHVEQRFLEHVRNESTKEH